MTLYCRLEFMGPDYESLEIRPPIVSSIVELCPCELVDRLKSLDYVRAAIPDNAPQSARQIVERLWNDALAILGS